MKLVLLWFIIYVSLSSEVLASVEFYPDVTPEDYVIEQVARRFLQDSQHRPFNSPGAIPGLRPDPGFTYRFPVHSPSTEETSPFAVSPSDPRYYEDTRSLTDNLDVIQHLFPRQPKSEEDYNDRFSFDLNTGPQTVRTPQEAGQKTSDEEADTETSSLDKVSSSEETNPSIYQLYKTPVSADPDDKSDLYFIALVAGCSAAAVVGVIVAGISWYKLQKNAKAAADVEYPAYGVTGPNKEVSPTGDRRLAQSAQMYHYQHQKQQIIAMESRVTNERNGSVSEAESEEENEEGDYTVYECPGLASTGEMEVKNPLFQDDPTPATPAVTPAPAAAGSAVSEQVSSNTADEKK
ncbi:hypothetical protein B7P43_G12068 [Cryptotermes secundus]|uniref:Neural proliferation differentiation and control protein 1 n=1 Tax=Cryptotermes secundus TaxID=105785 RepID=A0A2J7PWX2_9NEOP|nr:neural proliferation differentiation and control protein 1 [Cryptotermes secundus]PNF20832.1 hypothetical protein B7P43_G12068 [Cryptotermes secundus]